MGVDPLKWWAPGHCPNARSVSPPLEIEPLLPPSFEKWGCAGAQSTLFMGNLGQKGHFIYVWAQKWGACTISVSPPALLRLTAISNVVSAKILSYPGVGAPQ